MKRLQVTQKLTYERFYMHEKLLRTRNCRRKFIKNFLPKNAKKTCKSNNCDLNRDRISKQFDVNMQQASRNVKKISKMILLFVKKML